MAKLGRVETVEPGYYWYREDGRRWEPVEISRSVNGCFVHFIGLDMAKNLVDTNGEFFGPIHCNVQSQKS